jgi:hypothetical protein
MRTAAVLLILFAGCAGNTPPASAPTKPAPIARGNFESAVKGKTATEVVEAVGRPDETMEGHGTETWFYKLHRDSLESGERLAQGLGCLGKLGRLDLLCQH